MIEYIIYFAIAFTLMHFLSNVFSTTDRKDDEDVIPPKHIAHVKVRMECHNDCWYGFYHQKGGGEVFVAQGKTFEEATENCKERLNSKDAPYYFKLHFEKS
jgi:hypothetical protein